MALNRAKLLESADKLVRQGKIDEAIRQYLTLSEDNPRDVNTINRIGDLYVRQRKNKEAIRQFMRIADFYAGDGFHLKAIAMYKKITKLDPSHAEANERLADLYAKQGLIIEARTQFQGLAEQFVKAGQKPKAIEIYQKIQAMEPDNLKVRLILADLLGKDGDPGKAVDGFLSASDDLAGRKMNEEALKILLKALRVQPTRKEIHSRILGILRESGKAPQETTPLLEQLLKADPASSGILEMLAGNYLQMGRVEEYQKLKQAATAGEARAALAEGEAHFYRARGDADRAVITLRQASDEALRDVGPQRGASLLEQALAIRPGDVEILDRILDLWTTASDRDGIASATERLARVVCEKQDWERAALLLDRLQDLAPENPALSELRPRVDQHRGIGVSATGSAQVQAPEVDVPSLDDLEKVVELETTIDEEPEVTLGEERREEIIAELSGQLPAVSGKEAAPEPVNAAPARAEAGVTPVEEADVADGEVTVLTDEEGEVSLEEEEAVSLEEEEAVPLDEDGTATADEEEQGAEEEVGYVQKSVIQEMRGEPVVQDVDEDFLAEHFTEAEVFLKYGLVEKAREQLQTILARYPDHIPSLKKMREIHAEEGKKQEAAALLMKVAGIHRSRGEEEQAREMEEQAKDLDPSAGTGAGAPPAAAGPTTASGEGAPAPSLDSDLELDLDLPDLDEPAAPAPPAARQAEAPAERRSSLSAPPSGEDELRIELVDGEEEAEEKPEAGIPDPEKVSRFDFYLDQSLTEEAEEILADLERSAPGHPSVIERRARLGALESGSEADRPSLAGGDLDLDVERALGQRAAPGREAEKAAGEGEKEAPPEDGFFDLAEELKAQVLEVSGEGQGPEPAGGVSTGEEASIDEIFKAFRKKVDQQVGEEDYETRYNLGIAYKEMGLLDEAIGEFQYASRDPRLFLECCSILGICFREKGMTDLAIKWYRKALESTGHPEEKYQGLRYDLGELYAEKGDYASALGFFSEVYGVNSNYRDVASKIRELKKRVG